MAHAERIRKQVATLDRLWTETQTTATEAEDTLSEIEDREARRVRRARSPRDSIA